MNKYSALKKIRKNADEKIQEQLNELKSIGDEAERVGSVLSNISMHIDDFEREFELKTKLSDSDTKILFLAIALQLARQCLFTNKTGRINNVQGDRMVANVVPKNWHDILLGSVPYDAVNTTERFKLEVGKSGIGGSTHRYRTLGHDPVLGWIFGTMNILSDSLTKHDFITTYHVEMPYITGNYQGGTIGAFQFANEQIFIDRLNLPAAIARQALHFGSDYFTKQGLPLPFLSSIDNELSRDFLTKFHIDMLSVTRGASLSILINQIITFIHQLFYSEDMGPKDLYTVRTRRILRCSNVISTSSNILCVAISNKLDLLDVGGIIVTLHRLISDSKFINEIKKEFLEKKLYELIIGNNEF